MNSRCTCVVLNYNDYLTTEKFLDMINGYSAINHVVVVDNMSTDDSFKKLKKYEAESVYVINTGKNGGYGAGNNAGVQYVQNMIGDQLVLISNPDVQFTDEDVKEMIRAFEKNHNAVIVSLKQKDINGMNIKDIAWKIPSKRELLAMDLHFLGREMRKKSRYSKEYIDTNKYAIVDCVPGALLMVDSDKFSSLGGYDEKMFLFCEEILLAIKSKKAGYVTILISDGSYIHEHSVSINKSIKSTVKQYRLIVKNRIYLMKNYYGASLLECFAARIVSEIVIAEDKCIRVLKPVKNRIRNAKETLNK